MTPSCRNFSRRLLDCLQRPEMQEGRWQVSEIPTAWEVNRTVDLFLATVWEEEKQPRLCLAGNYGPTQGQYYARLPFNGLRGSKVMRQDLISEARYEREGDDLLN